MDDENGTVETAVISVDGGDPVALVNEESVEGEGGNAIETEATRIAEIEADTTVTVAAIAADVEQARIEADTERSATWEAEKEALQASIAELTNQVAQLSADLVSQSTPTPEPAEAVAEAMEELAAEAVAEAETVPDTSLTPEFTPDPTSETTMELGADAGAENLEVAAAVVMAPARKRRRLI